ncbi:hypothetical protein Cantr_03811 [Candida viswanathii]|uniref:Uncharacterized protein n=1 Tax=Candida viswanathii TaxID=5486 RepID=A0A367XR49_9ASCO|nr:hypothetical protein Cantr_03811 [Candida viswanathii]
MSAVIPQGRSKDDIRIPHRHLAQLLLESDRSSRSPSPVKNRYSLPILPKVDDDIRSVVSSPTELSKEQLRQAAKSPIAKKLHVISNNPNSPGSPNKYIIPVPFTLKLPPKLSSVNTSRDNSVVSSVKSSPQSSRAGSPTRTIASDKSTSSRSKPRQSKLIYTKNGYEKVDSSLESEGEMEDQFFSASARYQEDLNKRIALSKRPVPGASSTFMMNKGFRNTDELSIIEEVSINESRKSSVFSKLMTALKEEPEKKEVQPVKLEVPVPVKPQVIHSEPLIVPMKDPEVKPKTKIDKALPHIPPQPQVKAPAKPQAPSVAMTKPKEMPKPTTAITPPKQVLKQHKYNKSLPDIPTVRSLSAESEQAPSIPKSNRQTNLKLLTKPNATGPNNVLRIHKRSFSDESLTSSVSSFSSVGDFMHLARLQAMSPPTEKVRYLNLQNPQARQQQQSQPHPKAQLRILPGGAQANKNPEPVRILQEPEIVRTGENREPVRALPKPDAMRPLQGRAPMRVVQNHDPLSVLNNPQPVTILKERVEQKTLLVPPPRIATDRQTSTSSTSSMESLGSTSSWDSLQKSIDITYPRHDDDEKVTKKAIKPPRKLEDDDSSWLDTSGSSDDEAENEEDNEVEDTKPLNISRQGTVTTTNEIKLVVPDNDGPGISFHFPNDNTNVTNSKEVKSKVIHEVNRRARYSFYSNDGHIEIPDLTDKRVNDEYSEKTPSSYNGTTFSEIRTETSVSDCEEESDTNHLKIGVPGKAAMNHLKQQYKLVGDNDSDAELSSNMNSLFGTTEVKPKEFPQPVPQPELQCNILLPASRLSPPKHTRRKSLFNIDFDVGKIAKNITHGSKGHSRNKSVDLFSEVSTFGKEHVRVKSPTPEKSMMPEIDTSVNKSVVSEESIKPLSPHKNVKPVEEQPKPKPEPQPQEDDDDDEDDELMNIKVAEPPKIVNYEVDFKESDSKGEEDFGSPFVNPRIISKSAERPLKVNPKGKPPSSTPTPRKTTRSPTPKDDDAESVIIDLTKDKYEVVCMIDRSGSTRSYRSTTETINGKDVEVVLVDDDEEEQDGKSDAGGNYDELLSLYSKYRNNTWLFRNTSTLSSRASFASGTGSVIHTKKTAPVSTNIAGSLNMMRSSASIASSTPSKSYQSNRIHPPSVKQQPHPQQPVKQAQPATTTSMMTKAKRHQSMPPVESHYFDYASNENYDFNTFIQQRKLSEQDI